MDKSSINYNFNYQKFTSMKKIIEILAIAFLGGAMALGGYKLFFEKEAVVQTQSEPAMQTVQASYTPATVINSTGGPTDFTDAASSSIHAVVHVKNTAVKTLYNPYAQFFGYGDGASKQEQVGTGSGVIISSDGYIVTNNHVIDGANEIEITLNNRKKVIAELVGADKKNDIALLKIETAYELHYIPFGNSDNAKVGEWVLAVGNPYNLTSTVTAGIISAKGRDLEGNTDIDAFIQTDAAVNPGNSGGALVNIRGELVGINTAITSRTGSYIGYSFAVPSNITKKIIDDLLEYGAVQEAIIGVSIDGGARDIEGVRIGDIEDGSEALKAGLKTGDVITKVNEVEITKFSELKGQLKAKRPGDFIDITVDRDGKELVKNIRLIKKNIFSSRSFQVQLKDLTEEEKKEKGISGGAKIVSTKNKAFVYYNVGPGYIITKINSKEITSASDAIDILDTYTGNERMFLEMINTDGQVERYRF